MRIFCAVRHANDPRYFYGGLWSANFYPALRELGHEIIESQTDLLPTSRFMSVADDFTPEEREVRARTTERILDEVRAALRAGPVDLFLSYFYNAHFEPGGFEELRKLGVPSVNFYCNSIYQFGQVAAIAAKADFSWHAERDARASYLGVGANPVWVQMGADPAVYHPVAGSSREPNACFVGQRYCDRERWLAALVRAGLPLDIYGAGWGNDASAPVAESESGASYLGRSQPQPGSFASYARVVSRRLHTEGLIGGTRRILKQASYRKEARADLNLLRPFARGRAESIAGTFSRHEVCLNFSNVWADGQPGSELIPHVRLRDFEGPMCRTCYLTGHTDEITEFYDVGREIETYRTVDELVDKTRFYLAHPDAAEKLREAGYLRALRDHTWKKRFEKLLACIFSSKSNT